MGRQSLPWLIALLSLSAVPAHAKTPTPCNTETLSTSVASLRDTLSSTDDRDRLREIAAQIESLLDSERERANSICLAYLAGSAYFVLSSGRSRQKGDAFHAVRLFLRAQSMDPERMSTRQPRMRLRASWSRLGKARGWLRGRALVEVKTPPLPDGHQLILAPPKNPDVCPHCDGVFALNGSATLSIRPGTYRLGHRSPCGVRFADELIVVGGGLIGAPKRPACPVSLRVLDGENPVSGVQLVNAEGVSVPAASVTTETGTLNIKARGYEDTAWTPSTDQEKQTISMTRCVVRLVVETTPAKTSIDPGERRTWGRRVLRLSYPGHASIEREVMVPRPDQCNDGNIHKVNLSLPRAVSVRATGPDGAAVTPSRLVVDGEPAEILGFHRRPGQYTYAALHSEHGPVSGVLAIPACLTTECPPVVLNLSFRPDGSGAGDEWDTGRILTVTGSSLVTGGLVMGLVAMSKQADLDEYTNKREENRPIAPLIDARDEAAMAADSRFVLGGVTLTSALLWHWLGGDE